MDTTSTLSQGARETAADAREGVRQAGDAASEAANNLQRDLQALRGDFARLAEQVSGIVSSKGSAAWQRAKTSFDGAVSDAQTKGQQAVDAARDVSDNFVDALDESLKQRPYATLAIAAAIGFLFGATWRR
ncbi:MAG: hypothetical protein WBF58_05990 [Xanthobacteraceae bacterium]